MEPETSNIGTCSLRDLKTILPSSRAQKDPFLPLNHKDESWGPRQHHTPPGGSKCPNFRTCSQAHHGYTWIAFLPFQRSRRRLMSNTNRWGCRGPLPASQDMLIPAQAKRANYPLRQRNPQGIRRPQQRTHKGLSTPKLGRCCPIRPYAASPAITAGSTTREPYPLAACLGACHSEGGFHVTVQQRGRTSGAVVLRLGDPSYGVPPSGTVEAKRRILYLPY